MTKVIFAISEGCKLINPKSNHLCAPIPVEPKNSTRTNKPREVIYARTDILFQNQIGVIAILIISTKPTKKRLSCAEAHGCQLLPATEVNMIMPIAPAAQRSNIIGQFKKNSLLKPFGTALILYSR